MTIKDCIDWCDKICPNSMTNGEKTLMLADIEGRIYRELLLDSLDIVFDYTKHQQLELLVLPPYDDVYRLGLISRLMLNNWDYEEKASVQQEFEAAWNRLKTYVCRFVRPAYGGKMEGQEMRIVVKGEAYNGAIMPLPEMNAEVKVVQGSTVIEPETDYEDGMLCINMTAEQTDTLESGSARVNVRLLDDDGNTAVLVNRIVRLVIYDGD